MCAPAQSLTKDIMLGNLLPMMSLSESAAMARVCKRWNEIIQPKLDIEFLSKVVFGKTQWEQIPGVTDVGVEPVLTVEQKTRLIGKLKGVCPYFNQPDPIYAHIFENDKVKKMWQTFRVILIPKTINGKEVDINLIGRVFSFEKKIKRRNDDGTGFDFIHGGQDSKYRKRKTGRSYFLIVSMDIIPGSRQTNGVERKKLLRPQGFRTPNPLEASIMAFVLNLNLRNGCCGYYFEAGCVSRFITYMATDTLFDGKLLIVGAASSKGLAVDLHDRIGPIAIGAAAVAEVL